MQSSGNSYGRKSNICAEQQDTDFSTVIETENLNTVNGSNFFQLNHETYLDDYKERANLEEVKFLEKKYGSLHQQDAGIILGSL